MKETSLLLRQSASASKRAIAATLAIAGLLQLEPVFAQTNPVVVEKSTVTNHRYKIAVCDWMILKRQKLGAFQLTKDIGADGVEVDMGSLGERETFQNALTNAGVRQQFLDTERTRHHAWFRPSACHIACTAGRSALLASRQSVSTKMRTDPPAVRTYSIFPLDSQL
jgi:hypothetical protein